MAIFFGGELVNELNDNLGILAICFLLRFLIDSSTFSMILHKNKDITPRLAPNNPFLERGRVTTNKILFITNQYFPFQIETWII